jgi:hypothetical protein
MNCETNKNSQFSQTLQMLACIEEKLREIGVKTLAVNSALAGEATFTVYFDPAPPQEYTAQ